MDNGYRTKEKSDGEHFIIKTELPWVSEEKITVHYEDIYKYTPEKFKSLKKDNPL